MTASPHVAAAGSHYLNLLLPIIGLNHRSPIITSTGYNARAAAVWLALLALPPIRVFLLEGPRGRIDMFLMHYDVGVDVCAAQYASWESRCHPGIKSVGSS